MKSLTTVRKKSPNYPVEFKIKMVELSHRPDISVAQLAREHGINDNLLDVYKRQHKIILNVIVSIKHIIISDMIFELLARNHT